MIKDYLKISWREIRRRKLRSFLTLVGVFIGIAAIISLISLGQGLEKAITQHIQSLGNDKLFISAKGNTLGIGLSIDAVKIKEKDLETVRNTLGIGSAAGMIYTTAGIEFNDILRYASVMGLPTISDELNLIKEAQNFKILKGRFLENNDKYKAIMGYEYIKKERYGKEMDIGDKVLIHGKEFKIIGFLEKIGSPPDDQSVHIPLETYKELFNLKDEYGLLIAKAQAGEDITNLGERVEKELRESRRLEKGKEDLEVKTPQQLASSFTTILDIVNSILIGIAGISLLVGGIGIMNTMYTTVLQRTKEIGVMKAMGARNHHILLLFLIESGFYGLGGGLIGTVLGIGFAKMVEFVFVQIVGPLLVVEINYLLIGGVLLFSFVVGCLSGIAPAWRASKLNPVDSLRYE
ncbi:ABC transporter permease [Candidatus Woesearchaeota archaeon]|nr:ABC transporter permease [Candidatus Woesearchaeota archaeon]